MLTLLQQTSAIHSPEDDPNWKVLVNRVLTETQKIGARDGTRVQRIFASTTSSDAGRAPKTEDAFRTDSHGGRDRFVENRACGVDDGSAAYLHRSNALVHDRRDAKKKETDVRVVFFAPCLACIGVQTNGCIRA